MTFRLVPKSVTLNDLEWRNGRYFSLSHRVRVWYVIVKRLLTRRPASADRTACRQFQATGQPVSQMQASDAMTSRLPCYEAKCVQCRCFQCGSVPSRSDIKGTEPIYWYHSKGNWLRYNFAADSFYIMKLFSRLVVLYCRHCPKDDKFRYFIPILRKLGAA